MPGFIEIARETLDIIANNGYSLGSKFFRLTDTPNQLSKVVLYAPMQVREAVKVLDANHVTHECELKVDMLDSLTSAKINGVGKTLVLNFANAVIANAICCCRGS